MANLKGLIKLRKFTVEEKQKILSTLYREYESIDAKKRSLIETVAKERTIAEEKNSYETHASYILYAEQARDQVMALDGKLKELNVYIEKAQDEVREAFAEFKKIEIVQQNREDEEEREIDRKDSLTLDDIGVEGHRRKET